MARYSGKFFGASMGFLFGGPVGAILGGVMGHMFDAAAPGAAESRRPRPPQQGGNRAGLVFISNLVAILTMIAKADGRIQPEEVRTVRRFFETNFRFGREDLEMIRKLMQETARVDPDLGQVCAEFRRVSRYEDLLILMRMVYMVALADRRIDPREEEMIQEVVRLLGINEQDHRAIRGEFIKDEEGAFRILGLSSSASKEEIRKTYREMAIKYHPDKVSHLGEEFRELAKEKFQQINASYQEIRKLRGF